MHDPLPKPFCEKFLTLGPQVGEICITPEQLLLGAPTYPVLEEEGD